MEFPSRQKMGGWGEERWNSTLNSTIGDDDLPLRLRSSDANLIKEAIIIAGLVIILAAKSHLVKLRDEVIGAVVWMVWHLSSVLLSPLLIMLLMVMGLYRETVRLFLMKRKSERGKVVDLMEGPDVFWAVSHPRSRSVINVLAFIQLPHHPADNEPLRGVQEVMKRVLVKESDQCWKLLCLRKETVMGFHYWERMDRLKIGDHVRWIELRITNREQLADYLSVAANRGLPLDDSTCWEVLVGRDRFQNGYPVVFRIHHSVGDGLALLGLLMKGLNEVRRHSLPLSLGPSSPPLKGTQGVVALFRRRPQTSNRLKTIISRIPALLSLPATLLYQMKLARDRNILHGAELSGEKHVVWSIEDRRSEVGLMKKIKEIGSKRGCRFSDVLFTAVSEAFEEYFTLNGSNPNNITVVLPTRMPGVDTGLLITASLNNTKITKVLPQQGPLLDNNYSIGILKLPVASKKGRRGVWKKLERVKKRIGKLRSSHQLAVNYWLINTIFTLFPSQVIKELTGMQHTTLVVSNIPGPQSKAHLGIGQLNDMVFWVPHKENTGLGLSLLSYDGNLNLGLMADRTLIPEREQVQTILNNILATINTMYTSAS